MHTSGVCEGLADEAAGVGLALAVWLGVAEAVGEDVSAEVGVSDALGSAASLPAQPARVNRNRAAAAAAKFRLVTFILPPIQHKTNGQFKVSGGLA